MCYYYKISGKNKHVPVLESVKADSMKQAKLIFFGWFGDSINYVIRISKKEYNKTFQFSNTQN